MKYIDAHIHLYEYKDRDLKRILRETDVIAVSDDVSSSFKTIHLSMLYENVIPAIGIHPWNADKVRKEDIIKIEEMIKNSNIAFLGEVGLDKKFTPDTYDKQFELFNKFIELAKEYDLALNLHTPDTYEEVFNILIKNDISKAYFHWYAGPIKLAEEIINSGYLIGINVATLFKPEKYEKYLELDIKGILIESDGPYKYGKNFLDPLHMPKLVKKIAEVKNISENVVLQILRENLSKLL